MSVLSFSRSSSWSSGAVGASASDATVAPAPSSDHYQPQFDGLRALAVLTVMADHFSNDVPDFPLPDWIHLGSTGVRLFLVLSGYFITASLRRVRVRIEAGSLSARTAIGSFYWRRLLRILPAYVAFAAIALILDLGSIRESWAWVFTGTVNWFIAWQNEWPLTVSHLWSICVQEQFYLFWPLLILFLPRKWMMQIIISVALAGIAFRIGCVIFSVPMIARWVLPFGSLDSLAAGAALGWYGGRLRASRAGWLIAAICLAMLALAALWRCGDATQLRSVLVEPLEAGAFVILVARTATGFDGLVARFLMLPVLVFAGRISYGLYIYHILVAMLYQRWLPMPMQWLLANPSLRLIIFGTSTLLVAAVSWRILEQPVNRFRRKKTRAVLGPVAREAPVIGSDAPLPPDEDNWAYRSRKQLLPS